MAIREYKLGINLLTGFTGLTGFNFILFIQLSCRKKLLLCMHCIQMHMTKVRRQRRKQRALKSLEEGKVTFLKAAQMAGLSVWELADRVHEKGIVWIMSKEFISRDIKKARQ